MPGGGGGVDFFIEKCQEVGGALSGERGGGGGRAGRGVCREFGGGGGAKYSFPGPKCPPSLSRSK